MKQNEGDYQPHREIATVAMDAQLLYVAGRYPVAFDSTRVEEASV